MAPATNAELFARASAAIEEAKRLMAENDKWQAEVLYNLRRLAIRTTFHARSMKLYSPLDFPELRLPYQPFPGETDSQA
ncbi:hypothetical protein [Bradyrhizobium guangxiense]|uniref:hypothetical protein n=1 Tax=Bradyrhizobium guangxiense TaxID=1325115 RepID=UPI0010086F7E|nr:hypothetical protein [Bradyrhizobium guangxiense]